MGARATPFFETRLPGYAWIVKGVAFRHGGRFFANSKPAPVPRRRVNSLATAKHVVNSHLRGYNPWSFGALCSDRSCVSNGSHVPWKRRILFRAPFNCT